MGIYKTTEAKENLMALYDKKLASLNIKYDEQYVSSKYGKTHIISAGEPAKQKVVILHGINAGAPMTLEAITGLLSDYNLIVIDTLGQTTKSDEVRLPVKDNSYGLWLTDVFEKLGIKNAPVIGVSYGGFLLQRLIAVAPQKVTKAIFVVPGGFANGPLLKSMKQLSLPLMRFMFTKSDKSLAKFLSAFYHNIQDDDLQFHRNTLLGVKMDYRKPPLAKHQEMKNYNGKVYIMGADNDIFFPAESSIEKCKNIFRNFQADHLIKNTKHFPHQEKFKEINDKIKEWLKA